MNKKTITPSHGDVLVLDSQPYLVVKNRSNRDQYDLINFEGNGWYMGNMSLSTLYEYYQKAQAIYSKNEFYLQLVKK